MRIGVLGCGNMASAVAEGIRNSGIDVEWDFVTYTPSHTRAVSLAAVLKGRAITSLGELGSTDMVIVGCKPHQFPSLAEEMGRWGVSPGVVVSLMAVVPMDRIQAALKWDKVVRLMPSLPMGQGEGISLLCYDPSVGKSTREFLAKALGKCSKVFEPDSEELLDRLTVVTASGPAYVYYLARAFEEILNEWQGDNMLSRQLSIQLFKGASAAMEGARGESLEELIRGVTSEKGVTARALESFRRDNLKGVLRKGVERAWDRLVEIREGADGA